MGDFLPVSKKDMRQRKFDRLDFVLVTGDAYVDHHSFGAAIIARVLEQAGYKVGILAQPYFADARDMDKLGEPRLGFLVTAGNMDSMVAHYTVNKKRRSKDAYSPGGHMGRRPDRAVTVYSRLIRTRFPKANIILGGIEASLRRFAHYDYWSDAVRPSVLEESQADLLVYGMAEKSMVEVANALNLGFMARDISWIKGTCYLRKALSLSLEESLQRKEILLSPSYDEIRRDKIKFNEAFLLQYHEQDARLGSAVMQKQKQYYLIQNPPALPLDTKELDQVYALPFARDFHPSYEGQGGIPALLEVQFSMTASRGCFGSCSFCAITFHQGRTVTARSKQSLVAEAKRMVQDPAFKGYIHDVGGPTANFFGPACSKQEQVGSCQDKQCLYPKPCKNLHVSHEAYLAVLRSLREIEGVRKVFVRSGIRYDYVMAERESSFMTELLQYHISGRLKVAPEHIIPHVLEAMQKPPKEVYERFARRFERINKELGLKQYLVPYLISSHPGSRLEDAIALAEYIRDHHIRPEQVQDFYPVPGTLSTAMYYTERNPLDGKPIYVAKNAQEKRWQRSLLQYTIKENQSSVRKALVQAGREDLIGRGKRCLVPESRIDNQKMKDKRRMKKTP